MWNFLKKHYQFLHSIKQLVFHGKKNINRFVNNVCYEGTAFSSKATKEKGTVGLTGAQLYKIYIISKFLKISFVKYFEISCVEYLEISCVKWLKIN